MYSKINGMNYSLLQIIICSSFPLLLVHGGKKRQAEKDALLRCNTRKTTALFRPFCVSLAFFASFSTKQNRREGLFAV